MGTIAVMPSQDIQKHHLAILTSRFFNLQARGIDPGSSPDVTLQRGLEDQSVYGVAINESQIVHEAKHVLERAKFLSTDFSSVKLENTLHSLDFKGEDVQVDHVR
jgi:hypothetical protein